MKKSTMELTITGQPYSKANSRRLVNRGSRLISIKSEKALNYEEAALWQLKSQVRNRKPLEGRLGIEVTTWYASRRPDLDASLIFDVLQHAGVYNNDRQLEEQHLFKQFDKQNPRSEIVVWRLDD